MIPLENVCCFTGHRPAKLPWGYHEDDSRCLLMRNRLADIAESVRLSGYTHFIIGMAQGSDLIFCEEVIRLRNYYPDITIEAALPCETQAVSWSEMERHRYFRLVSQCNMENLLQREYTPGCMFRRNKYMVDRASLLVAVFDGSKGGTMQTVRYAEKKGLKIISIRP